MTLEEYEDNYRTKWEEQTKLDKKNNSALRLRQKPSKHAGQSKISGARGGRAVKARPYVRIS
tara:strand:+ start:409 stop:594 length:186 start_codon:yes stop_codon:yes gene_type:complete